MSMYDKNHYNIVISLQLIKINGKKKSKKAVGIYRAKNEPSQVFIPHTLLTPIDSIIESAFHQI